MNQLRHIGIIMDGNGRWAERAGRPRMYGHVKGTRIAKKIITECAKKNLEYLTLYAFSTENWLRPQQEVSFLMRLLKRYLQKEVTTLIQKNIRFTAVGQLDRLPRDIYEVINQTIVATQKCTGMNLVFALSYGSKAELVEAAKSISIRVASGELSTDQIDESTISQHLLTSPAPEIDLIIRTSGEKRLSNFMLWQAAYAELYFSDTLWPDFDTREFNSIIQDFYSRKRKFGNVTAAVTITPEQARLQQSQVNAELFN